MANGSSLLTCLDHGLNRLLEDGHLVTGCNVAVLLLNPGDHNIHTGSAEHLDHVVLYHFQTTGAVPVPFLLVEVLLALGVWTVEANAISCELRDGEGRVCPLEDFWPVIKERRNVRVVVGDGRQVGDLLVSLELGLVDKLGVLGLKGKMDVVLLSDDADGRDLTRICPCTHAASHQDAVANLSVENGSLLLEDKARRSPCRTSSSG